MARRITWPRVVAVALAAVTLVLVAAAVAVAFGVGRWGCASQAELERTRPPAEVVSAFADAGVALKPARPPRLVVGFDRPYLGVRTYRYDSGRAALWVLVCRARCAGAPVGLDRPRLVEGRQLRQFSALGNNIAVFATDHDRRSGRRLQARVQHVLNELDVAEDPDSRCYIQ